MNHNATTTTSYGNTSTSGHEIGVFYALRAMFYVLPPSETYKQSLGEVYEILDKAVGPFLGLILVEQLVLLLKPGKKKNGLRFNDGIASLSAGIMSRLPNAFLRSAQYRAYQWCFDTFHVFELPWDSLWTYVFTLLFTDMIFYWFHRGGHEINFLWAAHQIHHSSADYNLTTALRQSIFQSYTSWVFIYLPLALFVRPAVFVVHSHMNILYQFWIHTESVQSLGPLEYVLNTPSHHRVHHGRNRYCIDKNYGGVLIIWDRLFGTFQPELPGEAEGGEDIAYGLTHRMNSFDPIHLQVWNYKYLWRRFRKTQGWRNKLSVLVKGPGWTPGSSWLGDVNKLPEIERPVKKYDPKVPGWLNFYVLSHFLFVLFAFSSFLANFEELPLYTISLFVLLVVYCLTCFGKFFDAKPNACLLEAARVGLFLVFDHLYSERMLRNVFFGSPAVHLLFHALYLLSGSAMLVRHFITTYH